MSASYLDNVQRHDGPVSLDIVNNEGNPSSSPPKRLVLVKKSLAENGVNGESFGKPSLRECGKSKSWDSCDISWWKSTYGSLKEASANPCPKCSFPSTALLASSSKKKLPSVIDHNRPLRVPSTPARTVAGTSSASSTPLPSRATTSTNNAHADSIEDRIERDDVQAPSTPAKSSNSGSVPVPPTPSVSSTHRRSLSLLTPLLRRRDLSSRNRNGSGDNKATTAGTNPASSSFIPPGSPQHQARSNPATPAVQRKAKNHHRYLSSASSPLRQLFANSPLLSRRRNKNNNNNTQVPNPRIPSNTIIIDSSDDEGSSSHVEDGSGHNSSSGGSGIASGCQAQSSRASIPSVNTPFRDLETFQKHQLRQKVREKEKKTLKDLLSSRISS
jgi:hypothetical protein